MKLGLKHLAPYLPYRLTVKCMGEFIEDCDEDNPIPKVFDLVGLLKNKGSVSYHGNKEVFHYEDIFPILRPLSDLNKIIEINGTKFHPKGQIRVLTSYKFAEFEINDMQYGIIQLLFQWHFDVFGLIEKGLAIEINTLNE